MIPRRPDPRLRRRIAAAALLLLALPSLAGAVVLTGEVQALDAQVIYTPQANMSPVTIAFYVPEGTRVKKGDVLLRVDASQAAAQVPEIELQIEQARARAEKEIAELQVKALDAEVALVDARAALEKAKVDAAIPKDLISGLDYDKYQGELDHAGREATLKQREFDNARAAVERRRQDAGLEIRKLELRRDYMRAQADQAEVRADRDGVVLHGFNNNWLGGRIDEGSATMVGSRAGQVVRGGEVRVVAWALEPDRRGLEVGQRVTVAFDAFPGRRIGGSIAAIAGAPTEKPEWGNGRYFELAVVLDKQGELPLLPGMSARVDTRASPPAASRATSSPGNAKAPLRIDGEVYARRSATLPAPSIERLWSFNITQLAPDGAPVKKGDLVLSFDSSEVVKQLAQKQSELKEKQSQQEKLELDLAERVRNERLATADAMAQLEKARRKTEQPAELIAGIEYRKLVIARGQAESKAKLARRRERLAAAQRAQEKRLVASEVAQLQSDVARLQQAMAALQVRAPRSGLMMHRSNFNREKYDVGSQVYRGQVVAEIPDAATLAVRAQLPERDLDRVAVGMPVRVTVEGVAGSARSGKVAVVGRAVRSKSQVQPIPVVDLEIELDPGAAALKPGQTVRVELEPRA
jgi:multidrug resistance efflux pump